LNEFAPPRQLRRYASLLLVIAKEQVMPLFFNACPSFTADCEAYGCNPRDHLLYIEMGLLARHLIELYKSNQTAEFPAVFRIIERLHIEGDYYVKEAATIGMLESIQNIAGNNGLDPDVFVPWLGVESRKWWDQLNDFWQGKIPRVGVTIDEA
jgi:hypothetical protein